MPELPDIQIYLEHLERLLRGRTLLHLRFPNPFVLRTVRPAAQSLEGNRVAGVRRLGKRLALEFEGGFFAVIHLMIAGRLHWREAGSRTLPRNALAVLEFEHGSLVLTEAGTKRRASVHLIEGESALAALNPGGLEILEASEQEFADRLQSANHTLKRALTDPHLFSGIGNAYSDEILHRARLSPITLTSRLTQADIGRLYEAARRTLADWTERLRAQAGRDFPRKVTAFREGMAVHGRYREPCPDCGAPVQRIVYAENEANYCARCQTGGKLLADRALSRLLKKNWPRSIDEL